MGNPVCIYQTEEPSTKKDTDFNFRTIAPISNIKLFHLGRGYLANQAYMTANTHISKCMKHSYLEQMEENVQVKSGRATSFKLLNAVVQV